jgi:hypothetical protein
MIELGDAAPFQPLRFTRAALPIAHVYSWVDFLLDASIYQSSLRPNGSAPTGRANARPMTGPAKQSNAPREGRLASSLTLLANDGIS